MKDINSYELTAFNLEGQINLGEKCGLLKITRSDDDRLILVTDANYDLIDSDTPKPLKFANVDSALGFVLDIGIRKEKKLTYGHGFYFGTKLIAAQSTKIVSQGSFDTPLIEKIVTKINDKFHSNDPAEEEWGVKMRHLLDTYNNSRLLFPNFYNDSYLSLMRILDALRNEKNGRYSFALWVARVSPTLNQEIYDKMNQGAPGRLSLAEEVFNECLSAAQSSRSADLQACATLMQTLDASGKIIFSCFYSAYQYRSMFVHQGLPFPESVKDHYGLERDSIFAYLSLSLGSSYPKYIRKDGLQNGDLIDFHDVIDDTEAEVLKFKEKYYLLIPTWHFLKRFTRAALLKEFA
jgi:hypothetical protein